MTIEKITNKITANLEFLPVGKCLTLAELAGADWDVVSLKTSVGREFKRLVGDGKVSGLCLDCKTAANALIYVRYA